MNDLSFTNAELAIVKKAMENYLEENNGDITLWNKIIAYKAMDKIYNKIGKED